MINSPVIRTLVNLDTLLARVLDSLSTLDLAGDRHQVLLKRLSPAVQ